MAWQKGQSGNPRGRPTRPRLFSDEIIKLCNENNLHRALVHKMAKMALDGDIRAAQFLIERIEGKATQKIELESSSLTLQELVEELSGGKGDFKAPDSPVFN